mmetsp:Transcript_17949/g.27752  ORF Transcript_17949/g.27752 Transcript_17949/m.27752 type:complete len:213 (-) Transcript_17949:703-1341(-)
MKSIFWTCLRGACPIGGRSISTIRSDTVANAASSLCGMVEGHESVAWANFSPIIATYSAGILSVLASVKGISSDKRLSEAAVMSCSVARVPKSSCLARACQKTETKAPTPTKMLEYTVKSVLVLSSASKTRATTPLNKVKRMAGKNKSQLFTARKFSEVSLCMCRSCSIPMNKFLSMVAGFALTCCEVAKVWRTRYLDFPAFVPRERADTTL